MDEWMKAWLEDEMDIWINMWMDGWKKEGMVRWMMNECMIGWLDI